MPSIDAIDGLGHDYATKLRKNRIRTTEALLKRAATRRGRTELANHIGVSDSIVLRWVNRADLMRVKGVGSEYAAVLEIVGVDTIKELRRRKAKALTAAITEANEERHLLRRLPTEGMVSAWVATAAELEPLVRY
ncbi:MAG TPA: DUF4332 domain-containing protein [Acidimicrobiia bacterium]|nr:DUF4332 domain-containing protein [Acidimicrobiia bacterium]